MIEDVRVAALHGRDCKILVLDTQGNPVAGAQWIVETITKPIVEIRGVTGAAGTFELVRLPLGRYRCSVFPMRNPGFRGKAGEEIAWNSDTEEIRILLEPRER